MATVNFVTNLKTTKMQQREVKHLIRLYKDLIKDHRKLQNDYAALAQLNKDLKATLDAAKIILNTEAK